jgi:hypothetical protein
MLKPHLKLLESKSCWQLRPATKSKAVQGAECCRGLSSLSTSLALKCTHHSKLRKRCLLALRSHRTVRERPTSHFHSNPTSLLVVVAVIPSDAPKPFEHVELYSELVLGLSSFEGLPLRSTVDSLSILRPLKQLMSCQNEAQIHQPTF